MGGWVYIMTNRRNGTLCIGVTKTWMVGPRPAMTEGTKHTAHTSTGFGSTIFAAMMEIS